MHLDECYDLMIYELYLVNYSPFFIILEGKNTLKIMNELYHALLHHRRRHRRYLFLLIFLSLILIHSPTPRPYLTPTLYTLPNTPQHLRYNITLTTTRIFTHSPIPTSSLLPFLLYPHTCIHPLCRLHICTYVRTPTA